MSTKPIQTTAAAKAAKRHLDSSFLKKGIFVAVLSGMAYGLYTAFLTLGMSKGVWGEWYGPKTVLSAFVITYLLGSLGSAINDSISALWALGQATVKGKLMDFFRTLNTKPGHIMIAAALIGGPISSAAYVIAIQMAGSIVVPISALCPAIGAILGRVLFKQELNKRMIFGILICVFAGFLIGSTSFGEEAPAGRALGLAIALIAAFGWGLEGCVAGYGTTMIDYEIGISIRQTTSGLGNLLILCPIIAVMSGEGAGFAFKLTGEALTSSALPFFIVSGFFALYAYSLWYKGNSMCGAALGMACNGMFSFWGPFFCWLVIGVAWKQDGWSLPPVAWVAAVLMAIGIFVIAMNPMDLFKKKELDA